MWFFQVSFYSLSNYFYMLLFQLWFCILFVNWGKGLSTGYLWQLEKCQFVVSFHLRYCYPEICHSQTKRSSQIQISRIRKVRWIGKEITTLILHSFGRLKGWPHKNYSRVLLRGFWHDAGQPHAFHLLAATWSKPEPRQPLLMHSPGSKLFKGS